jgi:hypothetical protein
MEQPPCIDHGCESISFLALATEPERGQSRSPGAIWAKAVSARSVAAKAL